MSACTGLVCIDGRGSSEGYGSPGGDAGVMIRTLLAYYLVTGKQATREQITTYVKRVSHSLGKSIYIHTDSHAREHYNPETDPSEDGAKPENIGCGYIKVCVTSPQTLGEKGVDILPEIAKTVVITVYDILKTKPKRVGLVVLEGEHSENKVLVCNSEDRALNPKGHKFIYHPANEEKEALMMIDHLVEIAGCAGEKAKIVEVTKELNKTHWEKVIAVLAPDAKWKTYE